MAAPSYHQYVPVLGILNAFVAAVGALTVTTPVAGPLFSSVKLFGAEDVERALNELLVFDDAACFVIPVRWDHPRAYGGRVLLSRRTLEFTCLVSDRVYGDFDAGSTMGLTGTDPHAGAMNMADYLHTVMCGQNLGLLYVDLEPTSAEPFRMENQDLGRSRSAWAVSFKTDAGERRIDTGRPGQGAIPAAFIT